MGSDPAAMGVEVRAVEHPEAEPGQRALEALDRVLGERPDGGTTGEGRKALGDDFSEATRFLCGYRDVLVQAQRRDGVTAESKGRLQAVNGVLSAVLGGHFPLGDIPWAQVQGARDALAGMVEG